MIPCPPWHADSEETTKGVTGHHDLWYCFVEIQTGKWPATTTNIMSLMATERKRGSKQRTDCFTQISKCTVSSPFYRFSRGRAFWEKSGPNWVYRIHFESQSDILEAGPIRKDGSELLLAQGIPKYDKKIPKYTQFQQKIICTKKSFKILIVFCK